jgi:hypothetical protein
MKQDNIYRNWEEFEREERRRYATFQLSLDELAKDLYIDNEIEEEEEVKELNFDM